MIFSRSGFRSFDKPLFLAMIALIAIGLITVQSATQSRNVPFNEGFVSRQLLWIIIGLLFFLIVVNVSYQRFIDLAYVLYAINIVLLVLVLLIASPRLGAQRWFAIGAFAFQPSEFIKLCLVFTMANYVGTRRDIMTRFGSLVVPIIVIAAPFLLVLKQPDLGTALLLLPIFFSILYVSGAEKKYLLGIMIFGIVCLPFFWHFLHDYQRQRLLVFVNPNIDPLGAGYTIIQSKIAVGSGGLFGKGWLAGTQNQLNFLPERHTDFIFSVIGEEWGFIGSMIVVALYFIITTRALLIASQTTDMYGKAIAAGIASMFAMQVVVNIAMTIGLMPVVGIPLPLISYGGSSMITVIISIGLLISVGMRRSTF